MIKTKKTIVSKSVSHFASVLGLSPINVRELKIRKKLNNKIIEVVKHKQLTSVRVAELSNTYQTSISEILNQNIQDIPTDLMLRVLVSLGIRAKNQISRAA
jgi:predicted XRE-type DNA-binding protein